jgi:hypothetical protein
MTKLCSLIVLPFLLAVPSGPEPGGAPHPAPPVPRVQPSAYAVRAILLEGQPAPDGGTFTQFSDPALNDHGDLAFAALTTSPAAPSAIYLRTSARLSRLVKAGQPAPTGGMFRVFNDVILNDRGTVVFLGRMSDRVAHQGLYFARGGTIAPIVVTGQPAPAGGVFTDFANPTINADDMVAFVGRMSVGSQEGIFTSSEGSITPVVLSGQPAPTGGTFQFFLDGSPALNDHGQIAFVASTTSQATFGVYVLVGGQPVPVVTTDDEAPVGGPFTEFGFVSLTNAGTVGFVGRTAHSAIREGLYITGHALLVPLARQGEAVSGDVLTTFVNSAMTAEDAVVFQLGTPDPIPRAIFLATRTGVHVIVRAGDPTPTGRHFRAFGTPTINGRGQIAFVAEADNGRHGIYLMTPQ